MKMPIARARRWVGYRSPISAWPAGAQLASPMPTPMRVNRYVQYPNASPDVAVITLQKVTPIAITRVRFQVSLRRPSGTPATA